MCKEATIVGVAPGTSHPVGVCSATVSGGFWQVEQELVRSAVLPYQWRVLNDQVPGADPSYCMHNFRAAAKQNQRRSQAEQEGVAFESPTYTDRGFDVLPDDPEHPDRDKFYGFVFQDTDFSKWIEAVGYSLAHHPDPDLEATADGAIDTVCAAQLPNGYLDTFYILGGMDRHFTNLKDHHELYCLGHLIEGAVAYYEGTGKSKLLYAAQRFADYVASAFGSEPGKLHGYPGHEIAEMALVRLYEATGERRYLDLASYFVHQRGSDPLYFEQEDRVRANRDGAKFQPNDNWPAPYAYYQAHRPVAGQSEAVGHAVRAGYLYSGVADIARLTGDHDLRCAARALWRNIVDHKLYITGGMGATAVGESFSYNDDLPNDLAYSETCAAVALVFFARRMLELEPCGEYGDVMELALYNTVLAGMAMDGKSFFYVNPLEVRPDTFLNHDARFSHVSPLRRKWFGCACCPPNIARLVQSVQRYAYTEADEGDTLFVHLYIDGAVQFGKPLQPDDAAKSKDASGKEAESRANGSAWLQMHTEQPWSGLATATVHMGACQELGTRCGDHDGDYDHDHDGNGDHDHDHGGDHDGDHDHDHGGDNDGDHNGDYDHDGDGDWPEGRESHKHCTLAFRLPAWAGSEDVAAKTVSVVDSEGSRIDSGFERTVRSGYLYITGDWHEGDCVRLDFAMPVVAVAANGRVSEDAGKMAFMRGPMVYCAEECDNGSRLHLVHVDTADGVVDAKAEPFEFQAGCKGVGADCLGQVDACARSMVHLRVRGWREQTPDNGGPLYSRWVPPRREPVTLDLIPYFAWANRGLGEMRVFLNAG